MCRMNINQGAFETMPSSGRSDTLWMDLQLAFFLTKIGIGQSLGTNSEQWNFGYYPEISKIFKNVEKTFF